MARQWFSFEGDAQEEARIRSRHSIAWVIADRDCGYHVVTGARNRPERFMAEWRKGKRGRGEF